MRRRDLFGVIPAAAVAWAAGPRLRTAICAYSYRNELKAKTMTYDDLVHVAVETGVDGLDLTVYWFPNTSDEFLMPLRGLAYRNGVEIYSISIRTELIPAKKTVIQISLNPIPIVSTFTRWAYCLSTSYSNTTIRAFALDIPHPKPISTKIVFNG